MRGLPGHAPCTPLGVMRLLERYEIPTKGKKVVVIGRSFLTGLPQVILFISKGGDATTTCAHSMTPPEDLKEVCSGADIIVSCVGIARMIKADFVKPGATVVDVGDCWRCRFRCSASSCRCNYSDARWHWTDDHRLLAREHAVSSKDAWCISSLVNNAASTKKRQVLVAV